MNSLDRAIKTTEDIRDALAAEVVVAREERVLIRNVDVDGLPPGEGAFLPCTFWLADNLCLQGRFDEAREIFEHLLSLRNDLGLLAEEYDTVMKRQLGNFPQAWSHVALVSTGFNLTLGEEMWLRRQAARR